MSETGRDKFTAAKSQRGFDSTKRRDLLCEAQVQL
jgi:hypothetical protein